MSDRPPGIPPTAGRRWLPPAWTALFPLAMMVGVAGWRAGVADTDRVPAFFTGLIWPGFGAFVVVAVVVWLGWVLDID